VQLYGELAEAAGVPKGVWNMHARHGGLTAGYNAIAEENREASLTDLRFHGQHKNFETQVKHYIDAACKRRAAWHNGASRRANGAHPDDAKEQNTKPGLLTGFLTRS